MMHIVYLAMPFNNFYNMCMCVCVRERERERVVFESLIIDEIFVLVYIISYLF